MILSNKTGNLVRTVRHCIHGILISCMALGFHVSAEATNTEAVFKAIGHEPEWLLVINENRNMMIFTTSSGSYAYDYAHYGPTLIARSNTTTYMAVNTDHQMGVVIREKFCQDSENGKAHGTTVTVWVDDKQYNGCGDAANNDVYE